MVYSSLTSFLALPLIFAEVLETEETFGKLRDWIDTYLHSIGKYVEVWYDSYSKYRDFWKQFPLVVVGLSLRRYGTRSHALNA
jgi:hypothetical protein